jgi:hypothetical protein
VQLQIELLRRKLQSTIDFLDQHCAFFTFGENIGSPDCRLPVPKQFKFLPTRQPVVIDFWSERQTSDSGVFTTVGNWRQELRNMKFRGETYTWSKHYEFLKFIDLPSRTSQRFEIALSRYTEEDKRMLERKGWQTRHALDFSLDIDSYAQYIAGSHGEFTVAKDQNVRLRSGWFSDRSATYLGARSSRRKPASATSFPPAVVYTVSATWRNYFTPVKRSIMTTKGIAAAPVRSPENISTTKWC